MNGVNASHLVSSFHIRRDYAFLPRNPYARRDCQAGTALVMALVILMILTILGISSMNTSIMEQRMSGNIQDLNRAFEASESGLSRAINTAGAFSLFPPFIPIPFTFGSGTTATQASVTTTFKNISTPKPGSGFSLILFDSANFDQSSIGQTAIVETGANVELHQGVSQIISKSQQ